MAIEIRQAQRAKAFILFFIAVWLLFGCVITRPLNYFDSAMHQITQQGTEVALTLVGAYLAMELIIEGSVRAEMGFFDDNSAPVIDKVSGAFLFVVGIVLAFIVLAKLCAHCATCIYVINATIGNLGGGGGLQTAEVVGGEGKGFSWDAFFGKRKKKYKYKKKKKGKGKGRRGSRFGFF